MGEDPDFDIASDIDDSELTSWLDRPGKSAGLQLVNEDEKRMCKFLPPGNLAELYQHYASTRQLLGVKISSFTPQLFHKIVTVFRMFYTPLTHITRLLCSHAKVCHLCESLQVQVERHLEVQR